MSSYYNNGELYKIILPWISSIPDFSGFNRKSHNNSNWLRINEELYLLAHNKHHKIVLSILSSGSQKELIRIIDDKKVIDEFIYAYPGLTWILTKIAPMDSIIPFIIASSLKKRFSFFNLPISKIYIRFIGTMETAIFLRDSYPNLVMDDWIFSQIGDSSFHYDKGYIYWLLVGNYLFSHPELFNKTILDSIARSYDILLLKEITSLWDKQIVNRKENYYSIMSMVVLYGFEEGVDYLVNTFKYEDIFLSQQIIAAMTRNYLGIAYIIFNSLTRNLSPYDTQILFDKYAIERNDVFFCRFLLDHPRTRDGLKILNQDFYIKLIRGKTDSSFYILNELLKREEIEISGEVSSIIEEVMKNGNKECIDLFLQVFPFSMFVENILWTVRYNNFYIFEKLMEKDEMSLFLMGADTLLFESIRSRRMDFLLLLINHPRIHEFANFRLINEAKNLLTTLI